MGQLTYTTAQVEEDVRLTLEHAHLAAQLEEGNAPITTAVVAATPKNLEGVEDVTLSEARDFVFDVPNNRWYFSRSGATGVKFTMTSSLSYSADTGMDVILRGTNRGVAAAGLYTVDTLKNANDNGASVLAGHFEVDDGDWLEIYIEASATGNFLVEAFSLSIREEV